MRTWTLMPGEPTNPRAIAANALVSDSSAFFARFRLAYFRRATAGSSPIARLPGARECQHREGRWRGSPKIMKPFFTTMANALNQIGGGSHEQLIDLSAMARPVRPASDQQGPGERDDVCSARADAKPETSRKAGER